MAMVYLVRRRSVISGYESYVKDENGEPVIFDDRLGADLLTLICNKRHSGAWDYAYVLPVDPSCEEIIS